MKECILVPSAAWRAFFFLVFFFVLEWIKRAFKPPKTGSLAWLSLYASNEVALVGTLLYCLAQNDYLLFLSNYSIQAVMTFLVN